MKKIVVDKPVVSCAWLNDNLKSDNLVVLDATFPKVTSVSSLKTPKEHIIGALFFDLKLVFSDLKSGYPNTVISVEEFEKKVLDLGITNESCVVVYDDLGVYSSPRVWWMFNYFGFKNVAVLNGGLPRWKTLGFTVVQSSFKPKIKSDNFKATINPDLLVNTTQVLQAIHSALFCIVDARSKSRFLGLVDEPRKGLRKGAILNSCNLPYTELFLEDGGFKSKQELQMLFKEFFDKDKKVIFSCGSGITACILALGASLAGYDNFSIYDGSWSEWGSNHELPINKQ